LTTGNTDFSPQKFTGTKESDDEQREANTMNKAQKPVSELTESEV